MIGRGHIAKGAMTRPAAWLFGAMLLAAIAAGGGRPAVAAGPAVTVARATPAVTAVAPYAPAVAAPAVNQAPPKVYLFRGALGPIFSTGIDRLADKVERPASGCTSMSSRCAI